MSYVLFFIGERQVGATRSRSQVRIRQLMQELAELYPGEEIRAVYPPDYRPSR